MSSSRMSSGMEFVRSAMQALDSCLHVTFFAALDDENINNPYQDSSADCEGPFRHKAGCDKHLTSIQWNRAAESQKLDALKLILLRPDSDSYIKNQTREVNRLEKLPIESPQNKEGPQFLGVTNILHCQQHETWDCGILCLQMILRWIRKTSMHEHDSSSRPQKQPYEDIFGSTLPLSAQEIQEKHKMMKALNTTSIWTIDLIVLLNNIMNFPELLEDDEEGESLKMTLPSLSELQCRPKIRIHHENPNSNGAKGWLNNKITYIFCSNRMGVDTDYSRLNYYKKSFRKDERRVKLLFQSAFDLNLPLATFAPNQGISGTGQRLSMELVLEMITNPDVVAICLIDDHVIRRYGVDKILDWDGTYVYDPPCLEQFAGHYVIATGVIPRQHVPKDCDVIGACCDTNNFEVKDDEKSFGNKPLSISPPIDPYSNHCIVVKNPASSEATEFISVELFKEAWKAKGTDQDVIFIAMRNC